MTRKEQARAAAERIRATAPLVDILLRYGYRVRPDSGDREQQFSCDLHGDGRDTKPSARAYPATRQWYCFTCSQSRDVIQTVMAKEGLEWWPAIRFLEKLYHLEPLAFDNPDPTDSLTKQVFGNPGPQKTFDSVRTQVWNNLNTLTLQQELSLAETVRFWEAFDTIVWHVGNSRWTEQTGKDMLIGLLNRIKVAVHDTEAVSTEHPTLGGGGPAPTNPQGRTPG